MLRRDFLRFGGLFGVFAGGVTAERLAQAGEKDETKLNELIQQWYADEIDVEALQRGLRAYLAKRPLDPARSVSLATYRKGLADGRFSKEHFYGSRLMTPRYIFDTYEQGSPGVQGLQSSAGRPRPTQLPSATLPINFYVRDSGGGANRLRSVIETGLQDMQFGYDDMVKEARKRAAEARVPLKPWFVTVPSIWLKQEAFLVELCVYVEVLGQRF